MTQHRIAVIGLGMAVTPHAKSLVDLRDRVEVAYAFSRSARRRQAFAERFDFPITGDLERIVGDPAVDAVLILTPPNAHLELALRFAGAGKHILLEKPLERSTERARRLVEAAEAAGIKLGVVFQHRFREASEHLRALVGQGALGELAAVNVISPWWRPQSYYDEPGRGTLARDGGGVLITQAIHTLDLMLSLTGPVVEVAAIVGTTSLHRIETEDFAGAGMRFANGAYGALLATTALYPGFPERIELIGTAATSKRTTRPPYPSNSIIRADARDLRSHRRARRSYLLRYYRSRRIRRPRPSFPVFYIRRSCACRPRAQKNHIDHH